MTMLLEHPETAVPEGFGMHLVLRRLSLALVRDVEAGRDVADAAAVLGGLVVAHGDVADEAVAVPAYVAAGRRAVLDALRDTIDALGAGASGAAVDAARTFARRLDDHLAAREAQAMPVRHLSLAG